MSFMVYLQAELVAQFLCCIPLAAVEVVLAWLKPVVPEDEQQELLSHVSMRTHHAVGLVSLISSAVLKNPNAGHFLCGSCAHPIDILRLSSIQHPTHHTLQNALQRSTDPSSTT